MGDLLPQRPRALKARPCTPGLVVLYIGTVMFNLQRECRLSAAEPQPNAAIADSAGIADILEKRDKRSNEKQAAVSEKNLPKNERFSGFALR